MTIDTTERAAGASVELTVSEFVALLNQTLEFAYPSVVIHGELANLKIWRDRLVFFDLKDETAVVNCWAYISQLPGPMEDGMLLKVRGQPRYHPVRGFRFNAQTIQPAGEGSIKKAAQLLQAKLMAEGLFDEARKRPLPHPPRRIGLVTSAQSAAYADFMKIIGARWHGLEVTLIDTQVQGEIAPVQIAAAIEQFNALAEPPDVLVVIRGGGSAEDLQAFSTEQVTRAVAASRVPTLVAIGHEVDVSLAELAADRRASTPSNAAELLVPDRREALQQLQRQRHDLAQAVLARLQDAQQRFDRTRLTLHTEVRRYLEQATSQLDSQRQLLEALNPLAVLKRGYAIVQQADRPLTSVRQLESGAIVEVRVTDGRFSAQVTAVTPIDREQ